MRVTTTITAALLCASAPVALACSEGFSSNRNLTAEDFAWLFADYSVEDVYSCGSRCARACIAPGETFGACMGCARWKRNAQGEMDLPPCSKPVTSGEGTTNDGQYECHGYGAEFWNCVTPCPPGYAQIQT
ncbi:hypothetical protein CORC01_09381 [Colletotrichum orchidophilum]|uniref:Uncharacterized protein n=1 Tax=Colletotrichum orchidophilum TaxID=1209926 RepID=A0A1G4B1S6_9PEZI|nr:uncharacterized protein CORC01_09381 [Colletotrichum orchidophilum]OHE95370.1 hypothetical protein CORC01_09381 [Colletotrichum orchidophilum]